MNNVNRVIINTIAQYIRMVVNICLSLYSTRLILGALGVDDYGIYSLIAGTISLLSFVVNSLVITTQRYISFYYGHENGLKLKELFCNSLFIHLLLSIIVVILIEVIGIFLFNGFFNIAHDRISVAHNVYHCVTLMLMLSFVAAPFRALLIAHENIVYISIIDILDGVIKLMVAIFLLHSESDKLLTYSICLCCIQMLNLLAFSIYDYLKYEECIIPRLKYVKYSYISEISSFAGWTIFSTGCVVGRTQGFSIILNKFFSVAVNAAFGIALQINGATHQLSQALMNAMNPQIVKAEGSGNRNKMIRLSEIECKLCFLLLSVVTIPCIVEMPLLLGFWLKEVPEYAVFFCRFVLLGSLLDQLTIGLTTTNQAMGDIKLYSLIINPIKIISLVPIVVCLIYGVNLQFCMILYVTFEFFSAISRLFLLHHMAGISIAGFAKRVFLLEIIPIISILACSLSIKYCFDFQLRFLLTIICSIIVGGVMSFLFGLCDDEKLIINNTLGSVFRRKKCDFQSKAV